MTESEQIRKGLQKFISYFPEYLETRDEDESYFSYIITELIPNYLDYFLQNPDNRDSGFIYPLGKILSKEVFTIRARVGVIDVLIEYNECTELDPEGDMTGSAGATFTNLLNGQKLFIQKLKDKDNKLVDGIAHNPDPKEIQGILFDIFD